MSFNRNLLPDPLSYFEAQGLKITGPRNKPWFTTECRIHGGSDSMRVNQSTGIWVCMACGEKGRDLIDYEKRLFNEEFEVIARRLGAWVDDGKPYQPPKPWSLSPRDALTALGEEANLIYIAAANLSFGCELTHSDLQRLNTAAQRIHFIKESFK